MPRRIVRQFGGGPEDDLRSCQNELTRNANTIRILTDETDRKTREIRELTDRVSRQMAEIDSLKTEIETSRMKVHVHGSYSHNAPAVPTDFFTALRGIFPGIRTLTNLMLKEIPSDLLEVLTTRVYGILCPETDTPMEDYNILPKVARRAGFASILSRTLFLHFESRTFNSNGSFQPTHDKETERKEYARRYHEIHGSSTAELLSRDPYFTEWYQGVKKRLTQVLVPQGHTFRFLDSPQLQELCKNVWSLHKLVWAFPNPPEMIRFDSGDTVNPNLCRSYFNEVMDVERGVDNTVPKNGAVVYMVFPGFLLDTTIEKAEVLWTS